MKKSFLVAVVMLHVPLAAFSDTAKITLLHTNDLHDHVRPGYTGIGGMAYVAGYIRSVREERDNVVVIDAGDVMEKGDLVAFRDKSALIYESMAIAGYDAAVPGNHDDAYGFEQLRFCASLMPATKFVAINLRDESGADIFPAYTILDIDNVRIGVIGIARPDEDRGETDESLGHDLAKVAGEIESQVDITIVTTHNGSHASSIFSEAAPEVDIFISGHTHEILREPKVVEKTGAIILQAGDYAEYVGRVELEIDKDTKSLASWSGALIEMDHDTIGEHEEVTRLVQAHEAELSPEAATIITTCNQKIRGKSIAQMAAVGMQQLTGADFTFCHTGQIIRDTFPMGDVDINAIFRTGGQRGYTNVRTTVSGHELKYYVRGLKDTDWGQTLFHSERFESVDDVDDDAQYTIVMPLKEWDTRFMRLLERTGYSRAGSTGPLSQQFPYTVVEFTFTDAVVALLQSRKYRKKPIEEVVKILGGGAR